MRSSCARAQVASKTTKEILTRGKASPFVETPDQMVRRVCRGLGTKRQIIVLNDEAHHCYRTAPAATSEETLKGDERKEAEQRDREARVWVTGLAGGSAQDRSQGRLRPVGDAVLPARLGLPRRNALPLGGERLLADRRDRVRHRQDPARPGRRRRGRQGGADVPQPLAAYPRRPAEEERARDSHAQAAKPAGRARRRRCTASTATTRSRIARWEERRDRKSREARRRRSSSSSATTRASRSSSSTTSPAGRRSSRTGPTSSSRVSCRCSRTRIDGGWPPAPAHDPHRLAAARVGRGDEHGVQGDRRARDRGVQGRVRQRFPGRDVEDAHGRGPPARGHEHRRQAGQARRAGPLRRLASRC